MIDEIDDGVEKGNIVRNENKCIFVIYQIIFQPLDMVGVEVIGRLVQKQNVRLFEEQFCQQNLRPLSSRKPGNVPVETEARQFKGAGDLVHLYVDLIKVVICKIVL